MEYILENIPTSVGIYRCPDDIKNFKLRIKIKEINENLNQEVKDKWIEKEFSWQEKVFSKTQKKMFKDVRNCFTELEKEYHQLVDTMKESDDFLFSYVNEENICPENQTPVTINYLRIAMENFELVNPSDGNEYNFRTNLEKSIGNPLFGHDIEYMYLMVDLGEYFENIWIKNEKLLCTVKYNPKSKALYICPDFTTTQPYILRNKNENERHFIYFVEHSSKAIPESIEVNEKTLIKKLSEQKTQLTNHILTETFKLPPKNKLYVFIFLDILWGKNFEYPNIYVQYLIDLPNQWFCQNPEYLKGRTQICRATDEEGLVHFGHCVEVALEYNFMSVRGTEFIKSPYVYFEVISKDSWDRYRTEGLTYKILPVCTSGTFEYSLQCYRFTSKSPSTEMRRFFIGDCQNYNDLTWIGLPKDYEEKILNKYGTETIGTGQLDIRLNMVHQSQAFLEESDGNGKRQRDKMIFEKLESSALIKSVEQVIREFKKAKKHMLEVRKKSLN